MVVVVVVVFSIFSRLFHSTSQSQGEWSTAEQPPWQPPQAMMWGTQVMWPDDKGANLGGEASCMSRGNCWRHPSCHRAGIDMMKTKMSLRWICQYVQNVCWGKLSFPVAAVDAAQHHVHHVRVAAAGATWSPVQGSEWILKKCSECSEWGDVEILLQLIWKIFDELQCFYHPSTGFCKA